MKPPFNRPSRSVWTAMLKGARGSCPSCNNGPLYSRFLKVRDECEVCSEALHHHRADDAPPYFTIFIVGHIIIPAMLLMEKLWQPDLWIHMLFWIPLALILTLVLLPIVKGAVVGLQWALYMHGFELAAKVKRGPQVSSGEATA